MTHAASVPSRAFRFGLSFFSLRPPSTSIAFGPYESLGRDFYLTGKPVLVLAVISSVVRVLLRLLGLT